MAAVLSDRPPSANGIVGIRTYTSLILLTMPRCDESYEGCARFDIWGGLALGKSSEDRRRLRALLAYRLLRSTSTVPFPGLQDAKVGTYTDNVTMTLTY